MKYKNASDVLPDALLKQVQQYCNGCVIYVPSHQSGRLQWGEANGARSRYAERNREITEKYCNNASIYELAKAYFLSEDSIRKIVGKSKTTGSGL